MLKGSLTLLISLLPLLLVSDASSNVSPGSNGNATKEQVQFMVKNLLSMDQIPDPADASDALAAAICYNQNFRI